MKPRREESHGDVRFNEEGSWAWNDRGTSRPTGSLAPDAVPESPIAKSLAPDAAPESPIAESLVPDTTPESPVAE